MFSIFFQKLLQHLDCEKFLRIWFTCQLVFSEKSLGLRNFDEYIVNPRFYRPSGWDIDETRAQLHLLWEGERSRAAKERKLRGNPFHCRHFPSESLSGFFFYAARRHSRRCKSAYVSHHYFNHLFFLRTICAWQHRQILFSSAFHRPYSWLKYERDYIFLVYLFNIWYSFVLGQIFSNDTISTNVDQTIVELRSQGTGNKRAKFWRKKGREKQIEWSSHKSAIDLANPHSPPSRYVFPICFPPRYSLNYTVRVAWTKWEQNEKYRVEKRKTTRRSLAISFPGSLVVSNQYSTVAFREKAFWSENMLDGAYTIRK